MEVLNYNIDMTPESQWLIVSAGAFAKRNLLYLQEAGHFISGQNYYTHRKSLDSYLIKLTLGGAGVLEYSGARYLLTPGSLFWIDCQAPQHYYTSPDTGRWDVLWVHFRGATAAAYYEAYLEQTHRSPVCTPGGDSPIAAQLQSLLRLAASDQSEYRRDIEASALLTAILCELACPAVQESVPPVPHMLGSVRQYLHEHYPEKISLDTLSTQFNISKYHLQRSFSRHFGQSPGEYLTQLRLMHAKELLRATDLPISEVGYRVGMENTSYFISIFHTREGATPQQYRLSWSAMTPRA